MTVVECDVPCGSALSREMVQRAYFRDSYRMPLARREIEIVEVFLGIFAHHPRWMKLLLMVRNKAASLVGLDAPTASEVMNIESKGHYVVGDVIRVWPIYTLGDDEIVVGRDNKHLDFRLSVLKVFDDAEASVIVSTVCTVHNLSRKQGSTAGRTFSAMSAPSPGSEAPS